MGRPVNPHPLRLQRTIDPWNDRSMVMSVALKHVDVSSSAHLSSILRLSQRHHVMTILLPRPTSFFFLLPNPVSTSTAAGSEGCGPFVPCRAPHGALLAHHQQTARSRQRDQESRSLVISRGEWAASQ